MKNRVSYFLLIFQLSFLGAPARALPEQAPVVESQKSQKDKDSEGQRSNIYEEVEWVVKILLGGGGSIALYFTAAQLATRRRAHFLEIYKLVFEMLDTSEMREARSYVYK